MTLTKEQFKNQKIGTGEKLAYGVSNVGGNLVYATISSFATIYYTDSVGIAAATVGTMMILARIFDAFSDIAMGTIIDRTHRKSGQAKPWFVWSIIPLVISLILVFILPASWGNTAKVVYMYVTYIWSAVFCFTANSLSAVSMQSLMTGSQNGRMGLNASYQIFGFITIILVNMITSNVAAKIGWAKLSVVYAILATICLVITAVVCKERKHLIIEEQNEECKQRTISIKEGVSYLLKNRYVIIVLVLSILNYITIGGFNSGGVYYATYIYNNPALFGLMTLAGMLPTILLSSLIPALGKKFSKRNVLAAGYLLQGAGYLIIQFEGTVLPVMILGLVIKGAGLAAVAGLLIPMIGDVIEYEEKKSGVRLDGMMNAIATCGIKVGTGLGLAMVGWLLQFGGYIQRAEVQSASTISMIKLMVGGIPAICGFLGFLLAIKFDIERVEK